MKIGRTTFSEEGGGGHCKAHKGECDDNVDLRLIGFGSGTIARRSRCCVPINVERRRQVGQCMKDIMENFLCCWHLAMVGVYGRDKGRIAGLRSKVLGDRTPDQVGFSSVDLQLSKRSR